MGQKGLTKKSEEEAEVISFLSLGLKDMKAST